MADSPTPTSPTPGNPISSAIDGMAESIQQEVQRRSEKLMRVQGLQGRLQAARTAASELLKEIADIQTAFIAETGATAVPA